jgi:exonuclease III
MLGQFLAKQEIDIILLQEVVLCSLDSLRGYEAHINTGTNGRGTAIVAREGIPLMNVSRIPSDRGMAAELQGVGIVNIYAPSGAEKKQEREIFFNIDLPHLLLTIPTKMILGGDFNCVLAKSDCTGQYNYSRALNALVTGYALTDMWEENPERGIYTHYSRQGASRLDRIYVTRNIRDRKKGIETVVAAFTDHLAVALSIALDVDIIRRGRSYWKMNAELTQEAHF